MAKRDTNRNSKKPASRRTSTRTTGGNSARRKKTGSFHVTWEIELDAESPLAAAEEALAIMQDARSLAVCFTVVGSGQRYFVDLKVDDGCTSVLNLRTKKRTLHRR